MSMFRSRHDKLFADSTWWERMVWRWYAVTGRDARRWLSGQIDRETARREAAYLARRAREGER